jgi:hypothetical protein
MMILMVILLKIGFDYEVSSESDEDNDEWKGI